MSVLTRRLLVSVLALATVGCLAAGLLPDVTLFPFLSLAFFFSFLTAAVGNDIAACVLTGLSCAAAFGFAARVPADRHAALFAGAASAWIALAALRTHRGTDAADDRRARRAKDELEERARSIESEIRFYEERRIQLAERAEKRRGLSDAARRLGSLLDPGQIQEQLIAAAGRMFPGHRPSISYGTQGDPMDELVSRRRQPLLVPSEGTTGDPLIAAPIFASQTVAAILRVGGADAAHPYTREDMRLLDALASLASVALGNCVLFHQIQQSALRDNLTGLLTHRAFQDQLDAALLEASRYRHPLSIILADIDHFKSVNDTHGHPAGDQVLQAFAHVMDRNVRDVDIVARYGGEEFAILLLQTDHAEAHRVAEQIRQDFADQWFDVGGDGLRATASFGVATFPSDAASTQQLMREADQRLYASKRGGRNQVRGRAA